MGVHKIIEHIYRTEVINWRTANTFLRTLVRDVVFKFL